MVAAVDYFLTGPQKRKQRKEMLLWACGCIPLPNISRKKKRDEWMFGSTRIQLMIEDLSGKNLFSFIGQPDKSSMGT